jgi:D-proline reductase (dithiol) PrdB
MNVDVERVHIPDAEERWQSWEERSSVSHHPHFASARNETIAFHPPSKPLSELRVALATSGGLYHKDQPPFDMQSHAGDDSIRWIPGEVATEELRFSHDHYDHTDADQDPNCMFPLDRLREMEEEGIIGEIADQHVGFQGFIPNPNHFVAEVVPSVGERLRQSGVDAMIISPG